LRRDLESLLPGPDRRDFELVTEASLEDGEVPRVVVDCQDSW
jgi:hypothetical protein